MLEVRRFGRAKPGRLEFLRTDSPRAAGRITREQFRARLRRILAERFPGRDDRILYRRAGPRALIFRRVRPRAHARRDAGMGGDGDFVGRERSGDRGNSRVRHFVAGLDAPACGDAAPSRGCDCSCRKGPAVRCASGLWRFLRLRAWRFLNFVSEDDRIQKMDPADAGNIESWLVPRREVESALAAAREAIGRIHALALHMPPAGYDIGIRLVPGTSEVALCFRGLEFARWSREGILFGLGDSRQRDHRSN